MLTLNPIQPLARRSLSGRCVLAALLCLTFVGAAGAQTKMAVIDVEKILTDSDRGKAVIEEIKTFSKNKSEELVAMQKQIEALGKTFEDGRLSLAEDVLADMQKELEDKTIEIRRAQDDAERELKEMQSERFQKIEEDVLPIITEVGKDGGYTMILNKYQSGLVYADPMIDITPTVIERFDAAGSQ